MEATTVNPLPSYSADIDERTLTDDQRIVLAALNLAPHDMKFIRTRCPGMVPKRIKEVLGELCDIRLVNLSPHNPKYLLTSRGHELQKALAQDTAFWKRVGLTKGGR